MELLPSEIAEKIIHYLPFVQIIKCESINHQFKQIVNGYVRYHKYRKTITDALIFSAKNNDIQFMTAYVEKYGSVSVMLEILFMYGTLFAVQTFWNNQIICRPLKILDFCIENKKIYWSMLDRLGIPFLEWIIKTNNIFPKTNQCSSRNPDIIKWLVYHEQYLNSINDSYLFRLGMFDLAKELIENDIIKLDHPYYLLDKFDPITIKWCLDHYSGNGCFISECMHPEVIRYLVFEYSHFGKQYMDMACRYGQEDVIDKLLLHPYKHEINAFELGKYHHDKLFIKYFEMGHIYVFHFYRHLIKLNRTDLIIKSVFNNPDDSKLIVRNLVNDKQYDVVREMIISGCAYKYANICDCIELIDILIEHPNRDNDHIFNLLITNGITMLKKWFPKLDHKKIYQIASIYKYDPIVVTFLIKKDLIHDQFNLNEYVNSHINDLKLISAYITHKKSYTILDKCSDDILLKIMRKIPIPISCKKQWKRYDQIMTSSSEDK